MAKTEVVKIVFAGDIGQIKNAQKQLRQENKLTAESMQRDHNGTIKNLIIQTNKIKSGFTNLSNKTLGILGLGFGLTGLVRQAHEFNQSIGRTGDELTGLSDRFGSTSKAVGIYYGGLQSSFASMAQVKGAMMALGNEGIKVSQAGFKELTFAVADFSQITGVSADTVANLAGSIKGFGMATAGDMRGLLNSVVSIGLNGAQATQVIQQIGKSVENLAYFAKDGTKSVHALAKGISETVGFMSKLGVRTSTAISFMDKLTDPEQYGEMAGLLNRINISQADYFNMLKTEGGKQSFFDKLQQNLPALADQIQAIGNPIAQANFAKSLGVPMEIAAKLAGKTRGEIQDIIKQSVTDQKALEKKQSNAKQNQERFTEAMEQFKMNALMPLMGFIQKAMPHFMRFVGFVSNFVNRVLGGVTGYLDKFMTSVGEVFGKSNSLGELLKNALAPVMNAMGEMFLDGLAKVPSLILSGFKLAWDIFMKMPIWAQFGLVAVGLVKGLAFLQGINRGMFPTKPMYTKEVGGSGGSFLDNIGLGKKGILRGTYRGSKAKALRSARSAMRGMSLTKGATSAVMKEAGSVGNVAKFLPGASKLMSFMKFLGPAAAIIGGVLDVATAKTPEETKKAAIRQAKILGGMAIGAAIGSVVPILGTAVGGLIGSVAGTVAAYWDDINASIGNFIGIQVKFGKGLYENETKEKQRLETLAKTTKLTDKQNARLQELNKIQERITKASFTDNLGAIIGRIAGFFGADGARIAAKAQLWFDNFKTMFISFFNTLGSAMSNPASLLAFSVDSGLKKQKENTDKMISDAINKGNPEALKNMAAIVRAQQAGTSNSYLKDYLGTKAQELEMRAKDTDVYFRKIKGIEDAEKKAMHKETIKHLGGIGASTAKTADNTAPKKDPIREAFKALTSTEMMETQYAGTNFAKK